MYQKVNKVRLAHKEGRMAMGTWVQVASPEIVEVVGYQGYDYVIIDMEHGHFGMDTATAMIRAADATGVTPIVRVPNKDESMILKVLDAGAMGVLVPGVTTKEQAEKVVRAAKYWPNGMRGTCPWTRSTQYHATDWAAHVKWSNEETMVWLLVEGEEGVQSFEQILTVRDIDGIMMGPFDLSQTLGIPGQLDHPLLHETLQTMVDQATRKNINIIAPMLLESTQEEIQKSTQKWCDLGCKIVTVGGDRAILSIGFRSFLEHAQAAAQATTTTIKENV